MTMHYDVLIIGGGLSGLSSAALLAKRSLRVCVVDKGYCPGGSCGAFRRNDVIFDQGSSMLFGWGERGFNAHRFLFNCLEENIDIIRHEVLYRVHFKGHEITFYPDIKQFLEQLYPLFPNQREQLQKFYADILCMYEHVILEHPSYTTADEVDKKVALLSMINHPISYIKFLSYLNTSARNLLEKYFSDPGLFNFFDKLTSTYCYTTVEESPAILASVMFVDNHVGGSYYVAGSTLFLPGKLEKVIEEHGSEIINSTTVVSILFENHKPCGVLLDDGRSLYADNLIYSGTVWNLYGSLLPFEHTTEQKRAWAQNQEPTYPSVVLYATVERSVIDERSLAVEMLVGRIDALDEEEVTVYIPSLDDRTICASDEHIVIAIGPSFGSWKELDEASYQKRKVEERQRLLSVLEKRWPTLEDHVRYAEVATPRTIERFTLKNNGAVAGPKQMLGSHMFKRLHTRTEWDTLFCCGESTVMGTGTPTVTTSGIAAANAILKKLNLPLFVYEKKQKQYVHLIKPPFTEEQLYASQDKRQNEIQKAARRCLFCEHPSCAKLDELDVRGIMRRVVVGNFIGAKRRLESFGDADFLQYEHNCIKDEAVAIKDVCSYLQTTSF